MRNRAALALSLYPLLCGLGWAQNIDGTITGLIQDPSGSVVPGAAVTALNGATGVHYPAITTSVGIYEIPQLPPGRYDITVALKGFKTFVRQGLELGASMRLAVDVQLEMGSEGQTVTVSAAVPLVQSDTAMIGESFTQQQFDALPVGRDPSNVLALLPGGVAGTYGWEVGAYNGSRENNTDYKIDGAPATQSTTRNSPGAAPIEEMTEQVVMQTGNYSAEEGRGSSQITVTTIAGTNQFHGALFEYFQNEDLNANSFFNNLLGSARPKHRDNQFGGTIGGPVVVPHLYNGHGRTFFTFGMQSERGLAPGQEISTVPSAAQRAGNFAGLTTIYDPATDTKSATGATSRTAFPGNVIPTTRFDPVALKLLANAWPLPNEPGTANNYAVSGSAPLHNIQWQTRVDENISEKNRVTARISRWDQLSGSLDRWPGPSGTVSASSSEDSWHQYTIVSAQDTYVFRPDLVNVLTYGYYYERWSQFGPGSFANWAAQVGLPNAGSESFPTVNISGLTAFGGGALLLTQPAKNQTLDDTLLLVKGHHSLKVGFVFRHYQGQVYDPSTASGSFTFNTLATNNPATNAGGIGMASFLLGLPTSSSIQSIYPPTSGFNYAWPYYGAFLQDDYRVNKKLTLNLGVRWEVNMPFTESSNYLSNFDMSNGKLELAGQNGYPRTMYDPYYKGFSPRFGLAYSPFGDNTTVIRGGYGIFYLSTLFGLGPFATGPWNQSFTYASPDNGITFPVVLATGFPAVNPNTPLVVSSALSVQTAPRQFTPPYVQQWNLNVQRQLGAKSMLQVAYVGSKGTHIEGTVQLNQVPPNLLGPGNAQLNRPFPNVGNISTGNAAAGVGNSDYDALQVLFLHRFQTGFSAQVSYTFSKTLDDFYLASNGFGSQCTVTVQNNYDLAAEKSVACTDQPQVLAWSFVWQLPFGKGRAFLHNRWLTPVLGGWNVSSISRLQSGFPIAMTTVSNLTGSLSGGSRPNRLSDGALSGSQRGIQKWFNPGAYSLPAAYTFGNDSVTEPRILGPGSFNMNVMLGKEVHLNERFWGEIRCEADNAINHFNPGPPNASIGSPGVGTITSGNAGRSILLSVRIHY